MSKRYGLKGINDDQHECSVCGKIELKRVMWLVELDDDGNEVGEPFHCGTTCGANLMNRKLTIVNKTVKNLRSYEYEQIEQIARTLPEWQQAAGIKSEIDKLSFNERKGDPRIGEYLVLIRTAKVYAATMIPPMPIE